MNQIHYFSFFYTLKALQQLFVKFIIHSSSVDNEKVYPTDVKYKCLQITKKCTKIDVRMCSIISQ